MKRFVTLLVPALVVGYIAFACKFQFVESAIKAQEFTHHEVICKMGDVDALNRQIERGGFKSVSAPSMIMVVNYVETCVTASK